MLDTAPWYGHGISEIVIGYALDTILAEDEEEGKGNHDKQIIKRIRHGSLPRSNVIINTKIGRYESNPLHQFDFTYETTINSAQRSLERMNCGYIDVLQLHDPEFLLGMPFSSSSASNGLEMLLKETIPALIECRKKGWAKAIGVTGYPLEVQYKILSRCMDLQTKNEFGGIVFDQSLVYCHCNLHDVSLFRDERFPSLEENQRRINKSEDEGGSNTANKLSFSQFCQRSNVHLMCAAPLSMGLLTLCGPPSWHPASPNLKNACANAAKICYARGVDISSIAMMFALSKREVGCTLIGMKNVKEVDVASDLAVRFCDVDFDRDDDSVVELDKILSPQEKDTLDILLDEVNGPFAAVWSSGEYRWDGMSDVAKFWLLVEGAKRKDLEK